MLTVHAHIAGSIQTASCIEWFVLSGKATPGGFGVNGDSWELFQPFCSSHFPVELSHAPPRDKRHGELFYLQGVVLRADAGRAILSNQKGLMNPTQTDTTYTSQVLDSKHYMLQTLPCFLLQFTTWHSGQDTDII